MRVTRAGLLACCIIAAACGERPTQPSRQEPQLDQAGAFAGCISPDRAEALALALFRSRGNATAVLQRFRQVRRLAGPTPPGPNLPAARLHAFQLVDYILKQYRDGRLIGGTSAATQQALAELLNGLLCAVGLPPAFGPGALGPDGAAQVLTPSATTTTVVTETQTSGVEVPGGSLSQPALLTISRLPDFPGPLLTPLDQYPIFYEVTVSPADAFTQDVLVGLCIAVTATPPDPTRLRLAHNVPPFTPGSIEILPIAPVPFLDCTNAGLSQARATSPFGRLARSGVLLGQALAALVAPRPLFAATYATSGVGGTVRTFSPFGAVDTLGIMTPAAPDEQPRDVGQGVEVPVDVPPAVVIRTPTGRPMAGVPVSFVVTAGGGSVTGGAAVTDATGRAAVQSWTLGFEGLNALTATAAAPPGAGFAGNPFVFFRIAQF